MAGSCARARRGPRLGCAPGGGSGRTCGGGGGGEGGARGRASSGEGREWGELPRRRAGYRTEGRDQGGGRDPTKSEASLAATGRTPVGHTTSVGAEVRDGVAATCTVHAGRSPHGAHREHQGAGVNFSQETYWGVADGIPGWRFWGPMPCLFALVPAGALLRGSCCCWSGSSQVPCRAYSL